MSLGHLAASHPSGTINDPDVPLPVLVGREHGAQIRSDNEAVTVNENENEHKNTNKVLRQASSKSSSSGEYTHNVRRPFLGLSRRFRSTRASEDIKGTADISLVPDSHLASLPSIPWYSRRRFLGTLLFNLAAFIIPAIYSTLSILWLAQLGGTNVATALSFTYAGVVVECFNEGLPRAVW